MDQDKLDELLEEIVRRILAVSYPERLFYSVRTLVVIPVRTAIWTCWSLKLTFGRHVGKAFASAAHCVGCSSP